MKGLFEQSELPGPSTMRKAAHMRFSQTALITLAFSLLFALACAPNGNSSSLGAQQSAELSRTDASRAEQDGSSSTTAVVKSVRANLRDRPSRSGAVVGQAEKDERLVLISAQPIGPWYQVRESETGSQGWIHGNVITLTQSHQSATSALDVTRPRTIKQRSSGRSYLNVDGERVPSPVFSDSRPAGASARCRDGSYSFSRNRRGTCSHHGGVAVWF